MREPPPEVRTLLRLGAYQLAFAGVEPHAAVSTTVDLAPRPAAGFVNAVLRQVATTPVSWPDDATRLSYPTGSSTGSSPSWAGPTPSPRSSG